MLSSHIGCYSIYPYVPEMSPGELHEACSTSYEQRTSMAEKDPAALTQGRAHPQQARREDPARVFLGSSSAHFFLCSRSRCYYLPSAHAHASLSISLSLLLMLLLLLLLLFFTSHSFCFYSLCSCSCFYVRSSPCSSYSLHIFTRLTFTYPSYLR